MPVVVAMPRMLCELARHPDLGRLDARTYVSGRTILVVQYWKSVPVAQRGRSAAQRLDPSQADEPVVAEVADFRAGRIGT